jgi:hypothetical protein
VNRLTDPLVLQHLNEVQIEIPSIKMCEDAFSFTLSYKMPLRGISNSLEKQGVSAIARTS